MSMVSHAVKKWGGAWLKEIMGKQGSLESGYKILIDMATCPFMNELQAKGQKIESILTIC